MQRADGQQKRIVISFFGGVWLFLLFPSTSLTMSRALHRNCLIFQEVSKTTIHNATKEAIRYRVVLNRPGEKPMEKLIGAGKTDQYQGNIVLKLTFPRGGNKLTYRLNPGVKYAFQYDESGKVDVYFKEGGRDALPNFVPFVATPMDVVGQMLDMGRVGKEDMLYDLGCGDGRIVIAAAREFGTYGVGVDIAAQRIKESEANAEVAGVGHLVEFRLQDVLKADFSDATVIILYMLAEINDRLRPRFEKQLKPGVRVVSHNYPIPGWAGKLVETVSMEADDGEEHFIYLYLIR